MSKFKSYFDFFIIGILNREFHAFQYVLLTTIH